jgi:hypothetical protein
MSMANTLAVKSFIAQAPGVDLIKPFGVNLLTFVKLDRFSLTHIFLSVLYRNLFSLQKKELVNIFQNVL